jgi:hypothetical protein
VFLTAKSVTLNAQLSMNVGSRAASFASLSSAGSAIKLGFTTTTNTTTAITQSALAVAEEVGQTQVQFSNCHQIKLVLNTCAYTFKVLVVASVVLGGPSCNSSQFPAEFACFEVPWIAVQIEQCQLPARCIALPVSNMSFSRQT